MECNGAPKALQDFDWDGVDDAEARTRDWEDNMTAALGINYQTQFNTKKVLKEQLAEWLEEAIKIVEEQTGIIQNFKCAVETMKIELIVSLHRINYSSINRINF